MENLAVDFTPVVIETVAKQSLLDSIKSTVSNNPVTSALVATAAVAGVGFGIYKYMSSRRPAQGLFTIEQPVPGAFAEAVVAAKAAGVTVTVEEVK